ncbi:hypothetical protein OTU49_000019 [Cherax quadricarinatus]|uniref:MRH domain-containing protein n=1 Tax=Cherax quadricarinatus TaxID=27406 RepID=A0AAW0Y1E4_CHEQU|nr:cation-dependent mannose-6-phosphate receptor-like isoform X2 [Cherax quadricarinatus]
MMMLVGILMVVVNLWVMVDGKCVIDTSVNESERIIQERDLATLDPIRGERSNTGKDRDGNTYSFIVCEDLYDDSKNVSIIKTNGSKDRIVLGYNNRTLVTKDRNWLMLTFLGGQTEKQCNQTPRAAHILFVCDSHEYKVQIRQLNDSQNTLLCSSVFIVRHACVCTPVLGLSAGAVFFILLVATFGSYFTFGFFYLRLVKGAKGIEQIPHRNFWFKVGNILADGCGAVFRCDRYCGEQNVNTRYNGYSPLDDPLTQPHRDTERDSALLNP